MEDNQVLARMELARGESKEAHKRSICAFRPCRENFLTSISIVIPAHDEERYLGRTLDALNHLDYPGYEIIVVANGCTDRTAEVAHGKCHRLVALFQKNLGVARNLGARMASGRLLLFLDADTILEPDALRVIAGEFTGEDAGGTLRGQPDSGRFVYRLTYWLKNFIHRFVVHNGSSGIIICWKKDFTRVGGFDERLELRENSELIRRLKRLGRYRFISSATATTSMRRYERRGFKHIAWLWIKLWFISFFTDLRNCKYEPVR